MGQSYVVSVCSIDVFDLSVSRRGRGLVSRQDFLITSLVWTGFRLFVMAYGGSEVTESFVHTEATTHIQLACQLAELCRGERCLQGRCLLRLVSVICRSGAGQQRVNRWADKDVQALISPSICVIRGVEMKPHSSTFHFSHSSSHQMWDQVSHKSQLHWWTPLKNPLGASEGRYFPRWPPSQAKRLFC